MRTNTFRYPVLVIALCLGSATCSAQGTAVYDFYYKKENWASNLEKSKSPLIPRADRAYQALIASRTVPKETLVIERGDFYYQLVIRNDFKKSDCDEFSGSRRLNSVTADIERLNEFGTKGEEVKTVPVLILGVGIDPVQGKKIKNEDACRVRPTKEQTWTLLRYGGSKLDSPGEHFRVRFDFTYTRDKGPSITKILQALIKVPLLAGLIPPNHVERGIDVVNAFKEGTENKVTETDFRDFWLHPIQTYDAVFHVGVKDGPEYGRVEVYIKRLGSLVLDRTTKPGAIIRVGLRKENESFRGKFLEDNKTFAEKVDPATETGKKTVLAFCEKLNEYADFTMNLSTIDAALMRRSMLLDFKYEKAISRNVNSELSNACWTPQEENFIRKIIVPSFAPSLEKFGTYE